jgi:hypothetical protein
VVVSSSRSNDLVGVFYIYLSIYQNKEREWCDFMGSWHMIIQFNQLKAESRRSALIKKKDSSKLSFLSILIDIDSTYQLSITNISHEEVFTFKAYFIILRFKCDLRGSFRFRLILRHVYPACRSGTIVDWGMEPGHPTEAIVLELLPREYGINTETSRSSLIWHKQETESTHVKSEEIAGESGFVFRNFSYSLYFRRAKVISLKLVLYFTPWKSQSESYDTATWLGTADLVIFLFLAPLFVSASSR